MLSYTAVSRFGGGADVGAVVRCQGVVAGEGVFDPVDESGAGAQDAVGWWCVRRHRRGAGRGGFRGFLELLGDPIQLFGGARGHELGEDFGFLLLDVVVNGVMSASSSTSKFGSVASRPSSAFMTLSAWACSSSSWSAA